MNRIKIIFFILAQQQCKRVSFKFFSIIIFVKKLWLMVIQDSPVACFDRLLSLSFLSPRRMNNSTRDINAGLFPESTWTMYSITAAAVAAGGPLRHGCAARGSVFFTQRLARHVCVALKSLHLARLLLPLLLASPS